MKNSLLSLWQNLLGRNQEKAEISDIDSPKAETYEEYYGRIYQQQFQRVIENPEYFAHIFTQDRIDQEVSDAEDEYAARHERTEGLIQSLGEDCTPNEEPDLEPD